MLVKPTSHGSKRADNGWLRASARVSAQKSSKSSGSATLGRYSRSCSRGRSNSTIGNSSRLADPDGSRVASQVLLNLPPELQGMLLDRRVVFVRGQLTDATANEAIPQLLLISQTGGGKPIEMYLDSAGGSLAASLAIYDVMQSL